MRSLIGRVLAGAPEEALWEIRSRRIWGRVALSAWRQRVGGVLYARLRELDAPVPVDAMRELSGYARHVRESNRVKLDRALAVVDALSEAGVRCVLLKGAALLASIYADWSMRPMVDVDLLIDAADAGRADGVLQGAGWATGADLVRGDFFPRFHYEREYVTHDEPKVRIDLHVRPFRPMRFASTIPPEAMFESVEQVELCGRRVWVPNAEWMLIHLAAHAALHGANELRWLYDIYAWLKHCGAKLNVASIIERCRAWRLDWAVRVALTRVEAELGVAGRLPALLASLPRHASPLDRLVLWQAPHGESRHVTDVFVNAMTMPGWRQRAAYLAGVALPDASHLSQIYPYRHAGWPLAAYALRVCRVLTRPVQRRVAS